jgi:ComF family protein
VNSVTEADSEQTAKHEEGEPVLSRLRLLARHSLAAISDLLLPPLCLSCREPLASHDALCFKCWSDIDFIRAPLCDRLGLPMPFDTGGIMISAAAAADPPPYDRARAVAAYSGQMRELIHALKFRDRHDLSALFGRWLAEAGKELIREADVIVPVPLSRWRLLSRRFNQAAILSQDVALRAKLDYEPLALTRVKRTPSQVGLTRRERQENVAGAFRVAPRFLHRISGRNVILIDDVITTGATVGACAKALKRAGARRVDVLALALVTGNATAPS